MEMVGVVGSVWLVVMWLSVVEMIMVVPNLRPYMHSGEYMERRLTGLRDAAINHDHAGKSCALDVDMDEASVPNGFRLRRTRVWLGRDERVFSRATAALRSFSMINGLSWATMAVAGRGWGNPRGVDLHLKVGDMVASEGLCYCLAWSFNPSRIVCNDADVAGRVCVDDDGGARDGQGGHGRARVGSGSAPINLYRNSGKKGCHSQHRHHTRNHTRDMRVSQVAFSTVEGHLIAGEERFRVLYDYGGNGDVFFECLSFTRGAGPVGKAVMPAIRPLQGIFFRDVSARMCTIAAA
jgi:uncharacterized protein (UPF0548 family)